MPTLNRIRKEVVVNHYKEVCGVPLSPEGTNMALGGIRITSDSQQGIGVLGTARQFRDTVCENSQTLVPSADGRTRNLKLEGGNAPHAVWK